MTAPGERVNRPAGDLPCRRLPWTSSAAVAPAPARQALVDVLSLQVKVAVAAQRQLLDHDDVDPAAIALGYELILDGLERKSELL